jgi:hypothetical protein
MMSSNFSKNHLVLSQVNSPIPPDNSTDVKIYQRDNKLFKMGFDGVEVEITKPQEVSYYQTDVEADADMASFTFRVPNPQKAILDLRNELTKIIDRKAESQAVGLAIDSLQTVLDNLESSLNQNDAELSERLDSLQAVLNQQDKADNSRVSEISSDINEQLNTIRRDLLIIVGNIQNDLATKASRAELSLAIDELRRQIPNISIEAGSVTVGDNPGLTVDRVGDTYRINVTFPRVTQTVQTGGGGGGVRYLSKLKDVSLQNLQIGESLVWDGTAWVNGPGGGFTPIAGDAMTIAPCGDDFIFNAVSPTDYLQCSDHSVTIDGLTRYFNVVGNDFTGNLGDWGLVSIPVVAGQFNSRPVYVGTDGKSVVYYDDTSTVGVVAWVFNISETGLYYDTASNVAIADVVEVINFYPEFPPTTYPTAWVETGTCEWDIARQSLVVSISGELSDRIDAIVQEGTSIISTDGTIGIVQDDLEFDLSVPDYISKTEVASISAGLSDRIDDNSFNIIATNVALSGVDSRLDVIEGDYLTSSDLDPYITSVEVSSISANLQDQIDNIVQESTTVESSAGTITVTQDGTLFNVDLPLTGIVPGVYGSKIETITVEVDGQGRVESVQEIPIPFKENDYSIRGFRTWNSTDSTISPILQGFNCTLGTHGAEGTVVTPTTTGAYVRIGSGNIDTSTSNWFSITYRCSIQSQVRIETNYGAGLVEIGSYTLPATVEFKTVVFKMESADTSPMSFGTGTRIYVVNGQTAETITLLQLMFGSLGHPQEILYHNNMFGIDGGDEFDTEFYHLSFSQYQDFIGSTEVASISANLQDQIDNISTGGGLTWIEKSANYSTANGEGILANTSGGAWILTLPTTPQLGDTVGVIDAKGTFATNNLTVSPSSGDRIQGVLDDLVCDVKDAAFDLIWSGSTNGWMVRSVI